MRFLLLSAVVLLAACDALSPFSAGDASADGLEVRVDATEVSVGDDVRVTFENRTDRAVSLDKGVSEAQGISMEEAKAQRCAGIPVGRYSTIEEFGATCAFLCSTHAGFIVGQNILLDGGGVNATL